MGAYRCVWVHWCVRTAKLGTEGHGGAEDVHNAGTDGHEISRYIMYGIKNPKKIKKINNNPEKQAEPRATIHINPTHTKNPNERQKTSRVNGKYTPAKNSKKTAKLGTPISQKQKGKKHSNITEKGSSPRYYMHKAQASKQINVTTANKSRKRQTYTHKTHQKNNKIMRINFAKKKRKEQ